MKKKEKSPAEGGPMKPDGAEAREHVDYKKKADYTQIGSQVSVETVFGLI